MVSQRVPLRRAQRGAASPPEACPTHPDHRQPRSLTYDRSHALRALWYDFLVGDDSMIAAGVVLALALSAGLARRDLHAWWVLLVAVVVLLTASLWRETRPSD